MDTPTFSFSFGGAVLGFEFRASSYHLSHASNPDIFFYKPLKVIQQEN
jgi:hypothetical protein